MTSSVPLGLRIEEFTARDNRPGWCTSSATEIHSELTEYSKNKPFLVRHWSTISKILIFILLLILWCLLFVSLNDEQRWVSLYLTVTSSIVTFLEMLFVMHRLLCSQERKDTCIHKTWDTLLSITTWKKLIFYMVLSIPAFVKARECPMALSCGIIINLIGLIDFLHLFRDKNQRRPIRYRQLGVY